MTARPDWEAKVAAWLDGDYKDHFLAYTDADILLAGIRMGLEAAAERSDAEPELPGDIPLEVRAQVFTDASTVLRAVCHTTKESISSAIRALLPKEKP